MNSHLFKFSRFLGCHTSSSTVLYNQPTIKWEELVTMNLADYETRKSPIEFKPTNNNCDDQNQNEMGNDDVMKNIG